MSFEKRSCTKRTWSQLMRFTNLHDHGWPATKPSMAVFALSKKSHVRQAARSKGPNLRRWMSTGVVSLLCFFRLGQLQSKRIRLSRSRTQSCTRLLLHHHQTRRLHNQEEVFVSRCTTEMLRQAHPTSSRLADYAWVHERSIPAARHRLTVAAQRRQARQLRLRRRSRNETRLRDWSKLYKPLLLSGAVSVLYSIAKSKHW